MNRFSLHNKLIIEVSAIYERNRFFDYYDAKDIGKMDIAIRKSFLMNIPDHTTPPFHSKVHQSFRSKVHH